MEDVYSLWERREAERDRWLDTLPVCCFCNHPIQDEYLFDIEGNLYHEECAADEFRKWTDNYIS